MRKIVYLVFLILVFSCSTSDKNISGIKIPNELYENLGKRNISREEYIDLIKKSLNRDKASLVKLSLLKFDSILDFEHGEVLLSIIEKIGVNNYILLVSDCSEVQREIIYNHLEIGFEWNNNPLYKDKSLKQVYPELYKFLTKLDK